MAATVRTTCPHCGEDLILTPTETEVAVRKNSYGFKCPKCHTIVLHEVGTPIIELLLEFGASVGPSGPLPV